MEQRKRRDWETIKWIFGRLKDFRMNIGAIVVCFLFLGILSFLRPLVIRRITDEGLLHQNMKVILGTSLFLLLLAMVEQILELVQNRMFLRLRNQTQYRLIDEIFCRLLHLKKTYFDEHNTAEIMNTLNSDAMSVSGIADRGVMYLFSYLLRIISGFVGLLVISPKLASLVLLVVPVKYVIIHFLSARRRLLTEQMLEEVRDFSAWFGDTLNGIKEVKLWNLYRQSIDLFREKQKKLIERDEAMGMNDAWNLSIEVWLEWLLEAVIYIFGGVLLCRGELTLGSLFSFLTYSGYVTGPISSIFNMKMIFARILPAAERLLCFMEQETEEEKRSIGCSDEMRQYEPAELRLQGVSFAYGEHEVLKDVSLLLRKGEKIAVIGPNGSGKTTILNLLLRFICPESGEILLDGKKTEEMPLEDYRELFSVVSQEPYLFQRTAEENINLRGDLTEQEVGDIYRKSGIGEFINRIDRRTGQNGAKLSGGEKQKLAVARIMGKKASIILLDEVNSGLDPEADRYLSKIIKEEFSDKMVLMVTHRYDCLKECTRVYRLEEGKLEEVTNNGIY